MLLGSWNVSQIHLWVASRANLPSGVWVTTAPNLPADIS
jgi:hypothetical protein